MTQRPILSCTDEQDPKPVSRAILSRCTFTVVAIYAAQRPKPTLHLPSPRPSSDIHRSITSSLSIIASHLPLRGHYHSSMQYLPTNTSSLPAPPGAQTYLPGI